MSLFGRSRAILGSPAHVQGAAHDEVELQQHPDTPSRQQTMMRMTSGDVGLLQIAGLVRHSCQTAHAALLV